MAGFAPAKVKRKDLEEVYDEFSEFSLSSPARKIRRLDAELPPIMEEEEPAAALLFGQPLQEEQPKGSSRQLTNAGLASNEERAIVLYKPVNAPLLESPYRSNVFLDVNPDMIASFRSRAFWRDQSKVVNRRDEEAEASTAVNSCLAVVPWMPSQLPEAGTAANVSGAKDRLIEEEEDEGRMASEDADGASMDIEVGGVQVGGITPAAGMAVSEGMQHWPQQQHCLTPQVGPSPSESGPLMWSCG